MPDTTPAAELRAAAAQARGPVAGLLTAAADMATAYPEMAHDHDRSACEDYACELMGRALAVARAVLGEQPAQDGHTAPHGPHSPSDDPEVAATPERPAGERWRPPSFIQIEPYRHDFGHQAWVARCWGDGPCDGWVSVGHDTEQWARTAVRRHLADDHPDNPDTTPDTGPDTRTDNPADTRTIPPHFRLGVRLTDALWDAIAPPGPVQTNYVDQHQRVCGVIAAHLADLSTIRPHTGPDTMADTVRTTPDSGRNAGPTLACDAYQPPTTPADTGLCARCGMYDYKHQYLTALAADEDRPDAGLREQYAAGAPGTEGHPHITSMPHRPGEVMIHLPEFTYLDTQVWSVDIGIPAEALPDLRAAIDAYSLDETDAAFSPTTVQQSLRRELYASLNASEDFIGCPDTTADTLSGVLMRAVLPLVDQLRAAGLDANLRERLERAHIEAAERSGQMGDLRRELADAKDLTDRVHADPCRCGMSVIRRTEAELRAQRARLIASTGMDEATLRERADAWQLYPEHRCVWTTIKGIDYLLDGHPGEAR